MLPFRKIVFPVDYSEPCNAVIPYVKEMMKKYSASLTVIHAYGPGALAYAELSVASLELPQEIREAEEKRVREFALESFPAQHVEAIAALGDATTVVEELIHRQGADLVMMATRGHGAIRRFLLGSVTAKILHDVSCAVWTGVGSELTEHAPRIPYKSILCAVGFSDESDSTIKAASALAKEYGADLALVNVVETPPAAMEIDFAPIKKELMDAADVRLRELKSTLGVDAPHVVVQGPIAEAIAAQATRRKADLLVLGRGHAQGAVSRVWSHLFSIIRQSPCPVLSV